MPVHLAPPAAKALARLDRSDRKLAARVRACLDRIAADPTGPGCSRLTGDMVGWRIAVGTQRVLYELGGRGRPIRVTAIAHRHGAYGNGRG
ncbi:type II toxin-antitoxin system RelE/ParE family toxin [Streptomyces lavendulae]|uniref:type II toxin-antitoxin system RelE family toxin n=1 Tax=Streptomyces lavendulae TaxID=1914 RepID=UPI0036BE2D12